MSTTVDKLQEALRRFEEEVGDDPEFIRLRDFYVEMASKGLLVHKPYDLPLVDTIGRTAYQSEPK
jgi:hypothetical protein